VKIVSASIRAVAAHLKDISGLDDPPTVSREEFRGELHSLGLLGRRFGVPEYRAAVESALGVGIMVEEVRDRGQTWGEDLAAAGHLAALVYDGVRRTATILVRESLRHLPWPAYEMALYHELSHLMARHFLGTDESRPAFEFGHGPKDGPEESKVEVYEPEARTRARWLLLAGRFPEAFLATGTDRFP